jgi:hypothetical protein
MGILAGLHFPGHFRLSDFVYYKQGHLHFHVIPTLSLVAAVLLLASCAWFRNNPAFINFVNKPIPARYLVMGLVVVLVLAFVGWVYLF